MTIDRKRVSEIKTREDFVDFISDFVKSIRNGQSIENNTVDSYLEAMASWVEDMDGYYENMGIASEMKLDTMNWRVLADIVVAATMYE
ncbi:MULTISPECIES: DUF7660 family protein [Burkholderia]|uniref:DUF7660 family protein n=1 Tax=Burkholderia TaxID=32008 RepID=UPI000F5B535B|nr:MULTISPECIES: hypothetical protein [Burkholderia]KAB0645389.1 hypothetical protein F7R23_33630 [Burkholderia diffusa]MBM2657066.1 hypothetical protein [Burkholderia diffusa]RQR70884.1 hypothetical protein DIE11_30435 [Burkholderia sp. Bp9012]